MRIEARKASRDFSGYRRGQFWTALAILLLVMLTGCGDSGNESEVGAEPAYDGLSADEIQQQAESMTPQQAESLGIVDTSITVGAPIGEDSVVAPTGIPAAIDTIR